MRRVDFETDKQDEGHANQRSCATVIVGDEGLNSKEVRKRHLKNPSMGEHETEERKKKKKMMLFLIGPQKGRST